MLMSEKEMCKAHSNCVFNKLLPLDPTEHCFNGHDLAMKINYSFSVLIDEINDLKSKVRKLKRIRRVSRKHDNSSKRSIYER